MQQLCPRCFSYLPEFLPQCIYCNTFLDSPVSPSINWAALDGRQGVVVRLRKLYVDLSNYIELREKILAIKAKRRTFSWYFKCALLITIILALILSLAVWSIFPSTGPYIYLLVVPILVSGIILSGYLSNELCQKNKKIIEKELVEPSREIPDALDKVNQLIGMIPTPYRQPQYIRYLADLIANGRANSLYEAVQILQWEIDTPRREYMRRVQEINRLYQESEERHLKEAMWNYYIRPHDKY